MSNSKILVTGSDGQLGMELRMIAVNYPAFDFIFLTRKELSIENAAAVDEWFESVNPDFCINCAAYTAVDKAESEKELAFKVNAASVGHLAWAAKTFSAKFIHISTDYVFDGNSSSPLKENDPTGPISVYGSSKLRGEQLALEMNPETVIIRTAWVYSAFGNNFLKTMIRLMKERESVNVVNDQIGSPTYAADLAEAIMKICSSAVFVPGIFHYSNEGRISWYDFAMDIKHLTGSSCRINPIPSDQYPTAARRPHYSLLDTSKIRAVYAVHVPNWKSSLEHCLKRLKLIA